MRVQRGKRFNQGLGRRFPLRQVGDYDFGLLPKHSSDSGRVGSATKTRPSLLHGEYRREQKVDQFFVVLFGYYN